MSEKTWGGKREGAGRKPSNTKTAWVRLTSEQKEKFKKLGGSAWLQSKLNHERDLAGRKIVIDLDFERIQLMTEDELKAWEESEGPDRWEIYGPYECYDVDDAFCLLTDQLECALAEERKDGERNDDKINSICDCLKELRDFVRYGKEF